MTSRGQHLALENVGSGGRGAENYGDGLLMKSEIENRRKVQNLE